MAKQRNSIQNKLGGYIGLFRSLLDWEYAEDDAVFSCFVKLLLAVNYKNKKWCGKVIKRGSIVGSMETLCMKLHMKKDKLNRCLKALADCEAITLTVYPNKYHLISVNNYNMYQNIVSGISVDSSDNRTTDKTANKSADRTENNTADNPDTTKKYKKYIYKKEKKVSVVPTGQTDTVKKETSPTAVSPEGEPPAAFDYEKINWSIVQTFKGDDGRDLVYGNIPYKSVGRFSRANGIDDYTASEFYTAFERSKTPFPRNWQKILVRYDKLDSKEQDKFIERLHNGEFREKWKE